MKTGKEEPTENAAAQTRFYLIFDEFSKAEFANETEVSTEEIDEIEQVRRMIMEVTDDRPFFMTST